MKIIEVKWVVSKGEDMERRPLSTSQEEQSHQEPNGPAP